MFTRILRSGTKGPDVAELQKRLGVVADGHFGAKTQAAVVSEQTKAGATPDGIVGPATFALLGLEFKPGSGQPTRPGELKTLTQIDAAFDKGTPEWYEAAYAILTYDAGTESRVERAARRVLANKRALYSEVERLRGIPWAMVGMIHDMECACDPKGVLHNGELIVGTARKTKLVPKGRGPFNRRATLAENWLDAALDAVDIQSLWRVPRWTVGYMLKQMEAFNGLGYLKYHRSENSPYLWACTNINDGTGKYVADGKWSETANANAQVGAAATMRKLEEWGEFQPVFAQAA